MKQRRKGLLVLVMCMLLAVLPGNLAFASEANEISAEEKAYYENSASQTIQQIVAFTDEQIEQYLASPEQFTVETVSAWKSVKAELGDFVEITEQTTTVKDKEITVITQAKFKNGTASIPLILDKAKKPVSLNFNVNHTLAEKMGKAGLNTLMGLGVVFSMLIFLTVCIWAFKFFAVFEKTKGSEVSQPKAAPVTVPSEAAVEAEELVDDGELVAVIAAAIAAAENTSTDGFRVRSIKKANVRRWRNA